MEKNVTRNIEFIVGSKEIYKTKDSFDKLNLESYPHKDSKAYKCGVTLYKELDDNMLEKVFDLIVRNSFLKEGLVNMQSSFHDDDLDFFFSYKEI
jgi:hypothetical protein